jgi:KUP system potassium uptake protein
MMKKDFRQESKSWPLMLGALGVVYGDIGTSPLYALRECFHGSHGIVASPANVIGVLSLIFWSLLLIVSVKYLVFVLHANDKGEGGILTLLTLAVPDGRKNSRRRTALIALGMFGAALLYGDGVITPSISVLSAIEGLKVATPVLDRYVVPLTVVVLVFLFSFQHVGTGRVGAVFGPIMVLWFLTIGVLGIRGILRQTGVLTAFNPWHGLHFLLTEGWVGFTVLGAVFLVVTGGEALYADMGHFGVKPIQLDWFGLVLPALMLNYLGQGALLLESPAVVENPFYNLAPSWMLYPLVMLATLAAVIASQALISGAFSLTMHALQLGYLPRMHIRHTSSTTRGQIYMPHINWLLMLACIGLVLGFRSSSNLAAAYGIAVTLTMIITSILFYFAAQKQFNWSRTKAGIVCGVFLIMETAFFGANAIKIAHGGWFPLVVAAYLFACMTTWRTGRELLRRRLQSGTLPLDTFLANLEETPPVRVKGTAVFMTGNREGTPLALLHNFKHNRVLHDRVVLLTIEVKEEAHVDPEKRVEIEPLGRGLFRVIGRYGFMDQPQVIDLLSACAEHGLDIKVATTSFFLSREQIIPSSKRRIAPWREWLFAVMSRNAQPATEYFGVPPGRVVELGMQVEI